VTSAMLRDLSSEGEIGRSRLDVVGEILQCRPDDGHTAGRRAAPSVPTSRATRVLSAANERAARPWIKVSLRAGFAATVDRDLFAKDRPPAIAVEHQAICEPGRVRFDA